MNDPRERRSCPREDVLLGATVLSEAAEGSLLVLDLSQRGCRGTTPLCLSPGEKIIVKVPVDSDPEVVIYGLTQWVKAVENTETWLVGVEFHSFPQAQDSKRLLDQMALIQERKARARPPLPNEFESLCKISKETGRQMSALVRLNRKLNSSHKLEDVLAALLAIVTKVIRCEKALVMFDHGGPVPEVAASWGALQHGSEYPFSRELVKQVLSQGLPLLSLDVNEDAFLAGNQSLSILGTRSILCVPLTSGDKHFGVLYLDSSMESGVFGHGDQEIARVIAEMASAAIDRARYLGMLIQSEKMSALGTLLAGIAHELNGPLTAVLGVAELLRFDSEHIESAEMLHQQGTRCRDLVRKLTHLAHPWDATPRPFELEKVIRATLPLLKMEFMRRKVKLETVIAPDLPRLMGDEGSMSQVLLNLIQNALYALEGQPEPRIMLEAQGNDEQVWIAVTDNGPGVPPANLTRIFDPYFTTRARGEGTGLGLALVRTIVEQHGGKIEASNAPGGGAVFRATLPSPANRALEMMHANARFTN